MNNSTSPQEPSAAERIYRIANFAPHDREQPLTEMDRLGVEEVRRELDAHCAKRVQGALVRCPDCCGTGRISADQERDITEPCETCGGTGTSAGIRARANLADEMAGALAELLPRYAEMFVAAGLGNPLSDSRPCIDGYNAITKFKAAKAGQK